MEDNVKFINKLYVKSFIASTLALFGTSIGQIISAVIAGRYLSADTLSVITLTLPIYYAYMAMGALLGAGCTTVCARLTGQGDFEGCHRAFTLTYILNIALAVILSAVLLLFMDPIVGLLGAAPEIAGDVKSYAIIMCVGGGLLISVYPAYTLLRFDGKNVASAIVFLTMAAVTVSLDILLLFVFHMGVEGVAVAICAGGGTGGALGAFLLFARSKNFRAARLRGDTLRLIKDIFVCGSPGAMETVCVLFCMLLLNNLLSASFGVPALLSYKVVDSVNSFALVIIWGLAGAIVPFAGVFGAERDTKSIRQLLIVSLRLGLVFVLVYTVACLLLPTRIAGLFGVSGKPAADAVRIFAFSLPLSLLNHIIIYLYQACRRTLLANVLFAGRLLVWVVLVAYPLSARIGVRGVWHSFWIAEVLTLLTAALLSCIVRRGDRNLLPLLLLDVSAERQGTYKSFSVQPTTEGITESAERITEFCDANGLAAKQTMAISLAIEEMLVVTLEHSMPESINVRVLIVEDDNIIVMRIRNGGKLFNPVDYVEKAGEMEALEVMGVKIILKLAASVDYRNTFGVNNTTIIINGDKTK
jgi:Na+-driven multidrug efflux pump/anti-sigma regulatory factor (Ser/Thr protein kinase)